MIQLSTRNNNWKTFWWCLIHNPVLEIVAISLPINERTAENTYMPDESLLIENKISVDGGCVKSNFHASAAQNCSFRHTLIDLLSIFTYIDFITPCVECDEKQSSGCEQKKLICKRSLTYECRVEDKSFWKVTPAIAIPAMKKKSRTECCFCR